MCAKLITDTVYNELVKKSKKIKGSFKPIEEIFKRTEEKLVLQIIENSEEDKINAKGIKDLEKKLESIKKELIDECEKILKGNIEKVYNDNYINIGDILGGNFKKFNKNDIENILKVEDYDKNGYEYYNQKRIN